jgi:hypothetical protein
MDINDLLSNDNNVELCSLLSVGSGSDFRQVLIIYISVIPWRQFYWWRIRESPEITTDLPQVTDKL